MDNNYINPTANITCQSCYSEFVVINENEDDEVAFCPYCGEPLIEDYDELEELPEDE